MRVMIPSIILLMLIGTSQLFLRILGWAQGCRNTRLPSACSWAGSCWQPLAVWWWLFAGRNLGFIFPAYLVQDWLLRAGFSPLASSYLGAYVRMEDKEQDPSYLQKGNCGHFPPLEAALLVLILMDNLKSCTEAKAVIKLWSISLGSGWVVLMGCRGLIIHPDLLMGFSV